MAEAIEILKENCSKNSAVPTADEVPKQEHVENVADHEGQASGENVRQGSCVQEELIHEHKKKKKRKKPKPTERGAYACSDLNNRGPHQEYWTPPHLTVQQQVLVSQHHIQFKKSTAKNPRGRFMCKPCNYFCDSWNVLENHIHTDSHGKCLEDCIDAESVKLYPAPLEAQTSALTDLIRRTISEHGISKMRDRKTLSERLEKCIQTSSPGCTVKLYGSSAYMAGLANSDVNINVTIPTSLDRPSTMMTVYELIKADEVNNRKVNFNMSAELPFITFEDFSSNLQCCVAFNNTNSCEVAHILHKYLSLDRRALELATALRHWAHLCCLDQVECGTLPAHAFPILVIYYLQQLEDPVLPVLDDNELHEEESTTSESEVPGSRNKRWRRTNKMNLGELWLSLFRFYLINFELQEQVISIRTRDFVLQASKKWSTKKLAIEDPVAPHRNVAKTLINMKTFNYFVSCLRTSFMYFATPQMQMGPIFRRVQNLPTFRSEMRHLLIDRERFLSFICACHPCFLTDQQIKQKNPNELIDPADPNFSNIGKFIVTPEQAHFLFKTFNPVYLVYNFSKEFFVGEKKLPMVCVYCREEGHTKDKCPEDCLPPLEKLPNLPKSYLKKLSAMCEAIHETWALTPSELEARDNMVSHLLKFLNRSFPDANLTLFGSSCNGFGLKRSDIDICFTFASCPPEEELDFTKLIQDLYVILKQYPEFTNLVPITTAKVPILKFLHCESKLDGDISIHNTLALKNTKLVRTYSNIDVRAKVLGYAVKRFAKICNICDASKGSLSSYAYILMMIHFLQQCSPPVLPVLQEICRPCSTEEYMLENCDTYFFEDVERLPYFWPEYGKNDKSVGELWIEFLCFYTEVYKFKEYVISIRRKRPMSRFEKLWNSKSMAIEDPFDTNHNLGIGLSPKMHQFILKALRNGRSYFSHVENMPDGKPMPKTAEKYFEASKVKGSPPDRGCHNCKRIGHIVKDCPARQQQRREDSANSREYQRDRFFQSPKSAKQTNNIRRGGAKGNLNYRSDGWRGGSVPWEDPNSRNPFRHERGGSTKGSPSHDAGTWHEGNVPWYNTSGQKVGMPLFKQEKGRKTVWQNKSIPNAVPVTPLVSTPHWNIRPPPLQNVNVHPEIQVQLQALARKWHAGPEYNEALQPKERRTVPCHQPPQKFSGGVFDVYTRPSDVSEISSVEFYSKASNCPSNVQGQ